jgi:hypothetical protein
MPQNPEARQGPAFLGFGHERFINDDAPQDGHTPLRSINSKQAHPFDLQWKSIQHEWIVACHEQLAITIQDPLDHFGR